MAKSSTSFGEENGNDPVAAGQAGHAGKGDKPKVFKERLRIILERNKTVANIEAILDNPDHPQFAKMLEYATERAHGKVPTTNELTGEVVVRVLRDDAA